MKRKAFEKYLNANHCYLERHGAKHDIFKNHNNQKRTTVPRHPNIDRNLCKAICKQLEIPHPF